MKKGQLEHYQKKYGSLLVFLVMELLLFTSLNLANYGMLFRYLAILLALALIPITILRYKQEDWLNVSLMFILPLFAFGVFMAFSPLYFVLQTVVDNIAMVFSLISFLLIGISMALNDEFKLDRALAVIVSGLAIILTISLVYTMWRYTFFYVTRFAGMNLYFDGEAYLISNEAKWLFGFEFKEVVVSFFSRHGILLTSLLTGLLFVPFKQLKKWDLPWIIAGGLGLLSLILLPVFSVFKYAIPAILMALALRFLPNTSQTKSITKNTFIAFGALFALAAIFLLLFAFEVPFAVDLVANNAILSRVYGNNLVVGYAEVIQAALQHPFGGFHSIIVNNSFIESTKSAVFDTLYQGGIFAFLGYLAFLGFSVFHFISYYRFSQDTKHHKIIIMSFTLTYIFTTMFQYEYAPFVREDVRIYKTPYFSELILLLVIFFVGYAYEKGRQGKIKNRTTDVVAQSNF